MTTEYDGGLTVPAHRQVRRPEEFGAGEEIRTPDPRITNALLYQLSYPGEGGEV